jgi:hypothetical protein
LGFGVWGLGFTEAGRLPQRASTDLVLVPTRLYVGWGSWFRGQGLRVKGSGVEARCATNTLLGNDGSTSHCRTDVRHLHASVCVSVIFARRAIPAPPSVAASPPAPAPAPAPAPVAPALPHPARQGHQLRWRRGGRQGSRRERRGRDLLGRLGCV